MKVLKIIIVGALSMAAGAVAGLLLFSSVPNCNEILVPIQESLRADECKIAARYGSDVHVIYRFECPKMGTVREVLLTTPKSDMDRIASRDRALAFKFRCRINEASETNVYTYKGKLHGQTTEQRIDSAPSFSEGQK